MDRPPAVGSLPVRSRPGLTDTLPPCKMPYIPGRNRRSRSELHTTDTELNAMAAASERRIEQHAEDGVQDPGGDRNAEQVVNESQKRFCRMVRMVRAGKAAWRWQRRARRR